MTSPRVDIDYDTQTELWPNCEAMIVNDGQWTECDRPAYFIVWLTCKANRPRVVLDCAKHLGSVQQGRAWCGGPCGDDHTAIYIGHEPLDKTP